MIFTLISMIDLGFLHALETPLVSRETSLYVSAGMSLLPTGGLMNLQSGVDVNVGLGAFSSDDRFSPWGVYCGYRSIGNLFGIFSASLVDLISFHAKYETSSLDRTLTATPILGFGVVRNAVLQEWGTSGQLGVLLRWNPIVELGFGSNLVVHLYSDGVLAEFIPSITYDSPIHLLVSVGGAFRTTYSTRTPYLLLEKAVQVEIGYRL